MTVAKLAAEGSIPAHAGKPAAARAALEIIGVYPRPRGEAIVVARDPGHLEGLSPPTRGSRPRRTPARESRGSIPAHAGKPVRGRATRPHVAVYPRPRGEAHGGIWNDLDPRGLSPPTRGSRLNLRHDRMQARSIPAHAGKPPVRSGSSTGRAVYPRPRGEAGDVARVQPALQGLSPPTRGSRRQAQRVRDPAGSIPAHAGKPAVPPEGGCQDWVYPRPRGEARTRRSPTR